MLVYRSVRVILGAQHMRRGANCFFFMHDRCLCLPVLIWMVILGELPPKLGYCPKDIYHHLPLKNPPNAGTYTVYDTWILWVVTCASLVHVMVLRQKNNGASQPKRGWIELKNSDPSMDGFCTSFWFHSCCFLSFSTQCESHVAKP